jgi:CheY-like chemotaxis protein
MIEVKAAQKGLDFRCELSPDLPPGVRADERRLRQVLLNLLSNAVKFTDRGTVQLRVSMPGPERFRFEVRDTGIGIGADQLEAIFKPFEQAGDLQRRVGGTGLGLAISRQFLTLMGSDVQVESRVGEGSTFWFELTLPVIVPKIETAVMPEVVGYRGARKKILVVDDVADNRAVAVGMLDQLGFETIEADSGADGLTKAQAQRPDLILMDLVMPGMDGLEATRRLRASPAFNDVPIIMLSASASAGDRQQSLQSGANVFLPKPIEQERLLAQLGSLLRLDFIFAQPAAVPLSMNKSSAVLVAPPQQKIGELYRLARLGNMQEILRWASDLTEMDDRYRPFADQLAEMARRYQSRDILNLTRCYMLHEDEHES